MFLWKLSFYFLYDKDFRALHGLVRESMWTVLSQKVLLKCDSKLWRHILQRDKIVLISDNMWVLSAVWKCLFDIQCLIKWLFSGIDVYQTCSNCWGTEYFGPWGMSAGASRGACFFFFSFQKTSYYIPRTLWAPMA